MSIKCGGEKDESIFNSEENSLSNESSGKIKKLLFKKPFCPSDFFHTSSNEPACKKPKCFRFYSYKRVKNGNAVNLVMSSSIQCELFFNGFLVLCLSFWYLKASGRRMEYVIFTISYLALKKGAFGDRSLLDHTLKNFEVY